MTEINPYDLYGDEEFCWYCAGLLQEKEQVTVQHPWPAKPRVCCSEKCAQAAIEQASTPTRTTDDARASWNA